MTVNTPAPHVVAAADQFLAARSSGAGVAEMTRSIVSWIGRQWSVGVTPDALQRLDRDVEDLAFHLAGYRTAPETLTIRDDSGRVIDPQAALREHPELDRLVVPMFALQYLAADQTEQARSVWSRLSLADTAGDVERTSDRASAVVGALLVLVHHAGAAPAS